MKPKEKRPETVYRIIDRNSGEAQGSYSRACCDEFDFESVERARHANCHGVFQDKDKYRIAKYRVTYELINSDCDTATLTEKPLFKGGFTDQGGNFNPVEISYSEALTMRNTFIRRVEDGDITPTREEWDRAQQLHDYIMKYED